MHPKKSYLRRNYQGYLLMAPYLIVFFLFTVWPVIMSIVLSFTTYNVFEAPKFLGFDNYVNLLFNDSVFFAFHYCGAFELFAQPVSCVAGQRI